MASHVLDDLIQKDIEESLFIPKLSKEDADKIKRLHELNNFECGYPIAEGMLLHTMRDKYKSYDEIISKYQEYIDAFRDIYYMMPEIDPYCNVFKKLNEFVGNKTIDCKEQEGIKKYKLNSIGDCFYKAFRDATDNAVLELLK